MRISQTTGSWVSHLSPDGVFTHWVTATAAPCTSTYKPLWFDALAESGPPALGPAPGGRYDPDVLWWRHEDLHRETLLDYANRLARYEDDRNELQAMLLARATEAASGDSRARAEASTRAFADVDAAEATWLDSVRGVPPANAGRGVFARAWRSFDRGAGRPRR